MIRIGLVGRCQVSGIGDALLHMLDDCEVSSFVIQDTYLEEMRPHAEKALLESDIVFSHHLHEDHGSLGTNTLRERVKKLIVVPPVIFSGFHPDCIDLIWERVIHSSPLGSYHSAIVAAAYSLDVPVDRVANLFNKFVYKKLGYYDEFARARVYLERSMHSFGIDISGEWPGWIRSGIFMHAYNHPRSQVLASLARLLAIKAGLVPVRTPSPDLSFDFLSLFSTWPVYPEIAEAFGVKGSYAFKKNGTPDLVRGGHTLLSLREFIEGSYAMYADIPAGAFDLPVVAKVRAVLSPLLSRSGG